MRRKRFIHVDLVQQEQLLDGLDDIFGCEFVHWLDVCYLHLFSIVHVQVRHITLKSGNDLDEGHLGRLAEGNILQEANRPKDLKQ